MTPNSIEILIHYYATKDLHPRANYSAVVEATSRFVDNGILQVFDVDRYLITEKGERLVQALCNVNIDE